MIDDIKTFLKKYWYFILMGFIMGVGACYRIESYFIGRQIWHDEAMLLENFIFNDGFFWIFRPLKCFQMAPFGYLFAVKILTIFFGMGDFVLRFVPFLASLISIPVFYMLSKKFLNTKRAIIFANVLFCTNFLLARYASEFKQYGLDVLVFMATLLWVQKIDIKSLNFYSAASISVIFSILFFVSQPTVFLLFGFICYGLLKNIKNYKLYVIPILPLIFVILYKMSFSPVFNEYMNYFWILGFIAPNTFFGFIKNNLIFFLTQQNYLKFLLPFTAFGAFIFLFKKTKIHRILLFSMFGMIIASLLKCYPLSERLILYLIPFFIIFTVFPFDFKFKNKRIDSIVSTVISIFLVLFIFLFQLKILCPGRIDAIYNISRPKDGIKVLMEYFEPKNDIIVLPNSGVFTFNYYSDVLNFNIDKDKIAIVNFYDDEEFKSWLSNVGENSNKFPNYWIFIPDNYPMKNTLYSVLWLNEQKKKNGFRMHLSSRTILYKINF